MRDRNPGRPLCRHCCRAPVSRPLGLCWRCYYTPGVRALYPSTSKYAAVNHGKWMGRCKACGRQAALTPADLAGTYRDLCTTCKRPEPLRSQYHLRIDAYRRRAARNQPLTPGGRYA